MIEQVQQTLAPQVQKLPLTERYAVKEHLEKTITLLDGKLIVEVDADVGVPSADKTPIVRAVPANLQRDEYLMSRRRVRYGWCFRDGARHCPFSMRRALSISSALPEPYAKE